MNSQRTPTFLMANLGSEMTRLFRSKKNGQNEIAKSSADRAYKIIDSFLTLEDSGEGKKEAEILRMIIRDKLSEKSELNINENDLNSYFRPFALRVI